MSRQASRNTEPLRILQVIETGGPGGAETVFIELSDELQKRSHVVSTIVGGEGWLASTLRERGLPVETHRSRKSFDTGTIRFLSERIRRDRIDVIHAHLFGGALYAGLAGSLGRVPVVVTLHGHADIKDAGIRMLAKRLALRHTVSRVVSVSETLRRDLDPTLRLPARQHAVIPNGVRRVATTPSEAASEIGRAPTLVAIGNIRQPKGYPVLLESLALLRRTRPEVRLRIAGQPDGGSLMTDLQAQVLRLGLESNVEFLGFVSDPAPLLSSADCFVLASYREGFSLATIEAMLAGTPVVATRSGGPEEIIADGETGLLVPASDPEALANAISRVLDAPEDAKAMSDRARVVAGQRYGLPAMVDAYESLYRDVIASA